MARQMIANINDVKYVNNISNIEEIKIKMSGCFSLKVRISLTSLITKAKILSKTLFSIALTLPFSNLGLKFFIFQGAFGKELKDNKSLRLLLQTPYSTE